MMPYCRLLIMLLLPALAGRAGYRQQRRHTWWLALRSNGVDEQLQGCGGLLREH